MGFFFREKIIDGYFVKYKYTLRFLRENMFEIAGNYQDERTVLEEVELYAKERDEIGLCENIKTS